MSAAALAVGTGLQMYGQYKAGQDRAEAYNADAAGKIAQAAQVQIGADEEIRHTQIAEQKVQGAQLSAFGHSGVQATTGSPLNQMEDTAARAMSQITDIQNASQYKQTSLLTEAGQNEFLANESSSAGTLGMFSALAGGASNFYQASARKQASYQGSFDGARSAVSGGP